MKKYVKNENGYDDVQFDVKVIKDAYVQSKKKKKYPTSINLSEEVVVELKALALEMDIPYQALMRRLILEGLEKMRAA